MPKSVVGMLRSAEPLIAKPAAAPAPVAPSRPEPLVLNGAQFGSGARKSVERIVAAGPRGAARRPTVGGLSPKTAETMRNVSAKMGNAGAAVAPKPVGKVYRLSATQANELRGEALQAHQTLAEAVKPVLSKSTLSDDGFRLVGSAVNALHGLAKIVIDMGGGNVVVEDNRLDFIHGAYEIAGRLKGIA